VAFVEAALVAEASTTGGAGDLVVAGALTGYERFGDRLAVGDTFFGFITNDDRSQWEYGLHTYSALNTITRTARIRSSTGAAVNFTGTQYIYIDNPGMGRVIGAAASKATPVDADSLALLDSMASGDAQLARVTLANLKRAIQDGPSFSARASSNQTAASGVAERVDFQTEVFDNGGCFNNTGATVSGIPPYAFMPDVEGDYQVNAVVRAQGTTMTIINPFIYKNGAEFSQGNFWRGSTSNVSTASISEVVYLNGSTDYIEIWGDITATSPVFSYTSATRTSSFSAALVRRS
jgi:hypothetical protein